VRRFNNVVGKDDSNIVPIHHVSTSSRVSLIPLRYQLSISGTAVTVRGASLIAGFARNMSVHQISMLLNY
jgi:hypothetical protein